MPELGRMVIKIEYICALSLGGEEDRVIYRREPSYIRVKTGNAV